MYFGMGGFTGFQFYPNRAVMAMHDTAMLLGKSFFNNYLDGGRELKILDVGSMNLNGTLRDVASQCWIYTGIDIEGGEGVDVILEDPHSFPFDDDTFDAIVSTSCFEHDVMFWVTFCEMLRVLKNGGYIYINAPSNGNYHAHPLDNWRFYPDAGLALESWGRHNGVSVSLCESFVANEMQDIWNDLVMIFWKGQGVPPTIADMSAVTGGAANIRRYGNDEMIKPEPIPRDMKRSEYFYQLYTSMYKKAKQLHNELQDLKKNNN